MQKIPEGKRKARDMGDADKIHTAKEYAPKERDQDKSKGERSSTESIKAPTQHDHGHDYKQLKAFKVRAVSIFN